MMFVLLCGYTPFRSDSEAGVLAAVRRGNFTFHEKDWREISADAKDIIRSLLKLDPKDRLTAQDASETLWVRQAAPNASGRQLQSAIAQFRSQKARRKAPRATEMETSPFAAAWAEVSQWANSFLPVTLGEEPISPKRPRISCI